MHNQEKRLWELKKYDRQRRNTLIFYQILSANSVRECIEISWKKLYANIGAWTIVYTVYLWDPNLVVM